MKLYNLLSLDEHLQWHVGLTELIEALQGLLTLHGDTGSLQQYTVVETTVHGLTISRQPADDWLRSYYGRSG
jgi:hypothetical protein